MLTTKKPITRLTQIIKSNHVNALRKQYDQFLEDDKKRKERNKYILGRLDNMRYGSTAAQLHYKSTVFGELLPVYNRLAYRPEQFDRRSDVQIIRPITQQVSRPQPHSLERDVPGKYLNDSSLLKEISKKYILIPKLRPSLVDDFVEIIAPQSLEPVVVTPPNSTSGAANMTSTHTNISSNEDWKSKYDILVQLKRNEKELINKYGKDELFPEKESVILNRNDSKTAFNNIDSSKRNDGCDLQNYNTKESATKYEHEVPEKDLTFDNAKIENEPQNFEKSKISNSKDQEGSADHTPKSSASIHINPKMNTAYDNTLYNEGLKYNMPTEESVLNTSHVKEDMHHNTYPQESLVASEHKTEEATHVYNKTEHQTNQNPHQGGNQQEENPVDYEQPVLYEGKYPDPENVYLDRDDYSPIQVVNPSDATEVHKEESIEAETNETEVDVYPVDMLSVQEFTPTEDVKLVDGVNVNPKYLAEAERNTDPEYEHNPEPETVAQLTEEAPPDTSGMETYDAEQRETFYSEQVEEYVYDQQQGAAGEDYTQGYAPTEGYPPPEDYTYYENTTALQEQEYPVEINEHEETNSRYDQNYEQQYEGNYEQGQEQQQYDQPAEGYHQTQQEYQEYEYQQTVHETVENVEQVLDNEQGYAKEQNLETAKQPNQTAEQKTS